jgi:hypothetical protein
VARGWCRGALAESADGRPVAPWSRRACRWSPLGALTRAWLEAPVGRPEDLRAAYAALAIVTGGRPDEWNAASWRTRWHVLSAFGRARLALPDAREQTRPRSGMRRAGR